MKLYATTTSERASKGQGGNEYLEIPIIINGDESRIPTFILKVIRWESRHSGTKIELHDLRKNYSTHVYQEFILDQQTKGEKQKSEKPLCECDTSKKCPHIPF